MAKVKIVQIVAHCHIPYQYFCIFQTTHPNYHRIQMQLPGSTFQFPCCICRGTCNHTFLYTTLPPQIVMCTRPVSSIPVNGEFSAFDA